MFLRVKKTLLAISTVSFIAIACGGSNTTQNTNPTTNPPVSQDAGATTTNDTGKDAGPDKAGQLEAQRDPFVQACMRKMPAQAYCACAFDQFKDVFKDSDLTTKPSDAQMDSLKQKTLDNCATKLTEADVKPVFTNECVGSNPKKQPWCECEYTTLRTKLQPSDFVADFDAPKYTDAKKAVATTCKGKITEEIEKSDFTTMCSKGVAERAKICDCIWKKLRSKASVEEIAAGAIDIKKAGIETCKTQ
jgi:hypothetical protein